MNAASIRVGVENEIVVREGDVVGDFEVTAFPKPPGKSGRVRLVCPLCGNAREVRELEYEHILAGVIGRPTCRHRPRGPFR
jgi:hypothetical protein